MTRYIVEYRRLCKYTNELTDWTSYHTTHDRGTATEMYARHVSNYPTEEARMISFVEDPIVDYEFTPYPKDEEEAA